MTYALIIVTGIMVCIWAVYRVERKNFRETYRETYTADLQAVHDELFVKERQRKATQLSCARLRGENSKLWRRVDELSELRKTLAHTASRLILEKDALKRQLANRKGQITKLKTKLDGLRLVRDEFGKEGGGE